MSDTALIERVPDNFPYETVTQAGTGMMITGVIGFLLGWARGDRGGATRGVSIAIAILGLAVAGGTMLLQRQVKIEGAEDRVLAELDALDPVARAQVLKSVADEQLKDLKGE